MLADARDIAVVPYGGGTSVVGGVTARGGAHKAVITLDLSGMDRLIDVDAVSAYGDGRSGHLAARRSKRRWPPRASRSAIIRRASSSRRWAAGFRIAAPASNRAATARRRTGSSRPSSQRRAARSTTEDFPASAAGPWLTDLFVGAEGTFGVVTEATFRVRALAKTRHYCGFLFRDFESGGAAIREAVQADVPVAMLRLSDAAETHFYRAYSEVGKRAGLMSWLAQRTLDLRGFDANAAAMIVGLEGDADTVASGTPALFRPSRSSWVRFRSARGPASAGMTAASTDPICAIR